MRSRVYSPRAYHMQKSTRMREPRVKDAAGSISSRSDADFFPKPRGSAWCRTIRLTHLLLESLQFIDEILLKEELLHALHVPLQLLHFGSARALQAPAFETEAEDGDHEGERTQDRVPARSESRPVESLLQISLRDVQVLPRDVQEGPRLLLHKIVAHQLLLHRYRVALLYWYHGHHHESRIGRRWSLRRRCCASVNFQHAGSRVHMHIRLKMRSVVGRGVNNGNDLEENRREFRSPSNFRLMPEEHLSRSLHFLSGANFRKVVPTQNICFSCKYSRQCTVHT